MNTLLELTLADMLRECEALGIDTIEHSETIQEMYEDGFDSYEVMSGLLAKLYGIGL